MAYIYGADVSKHQLDTVIKELAAGGNADFVIARASIGSYTEDAKLKIFAPDIKAAGFKNSYYAASYAKNPQEAEEEAEFICDLCEKYGNPPELAIMFDWEYFSANYIKENFGIETTPQLVQAMTEAFCERVKRRGYTAGVYLNKDYWDRFYTDVFFAKHPDYKIWYARPGYSKPDKQCDIWQYASDNGAEFGYTGGNLDKNILITGYIDEVNVEPMKPLADGSVRVIFGPADEAALKKLQVKIEGLGIHTDMEKQPGYLITNDMSRGDQCTMMIDANALAVAYAIYTEPEAPQCESCEQLKAQIAQMEENHKAESDGYFKTIDEYIREIHKYEEQLAEANEKVEIADKQIKSNDFYIEQMKTEKFNLEADIDQLKIQLAAMATEKGVLKETIVSLQKQIEELKQPKPPEKKCLFEKILDILFGGM